MAPKAILVFCDGTGMDGLLSEPADTAIISGIHRQYPSNVLRLSRAVHHGSTSQRQQIVFYQSGVGSEANFEGENGIPALFMKLLGTFVASKIRDAYAFIAQNFEEGDEISIFGFSRGAYTARKLAGLIDRIGLLKRESLGYFFVIWKQLLKKQNPRIPAGTRRTRVKCVGVWDTVGRIMNASDVLNIKDNHLPDSIDVALHAISLQENRDEYAPTLWAAPEGGLRDGQILKQIWFPGAHSDVGGGYSRSELADISLYWMAGEIKDFVNLDLKFLQRSEQPSPDPWGSSQPHNAYEELSDILKKAIKPQTRLEGGLITEQSVFHHSFAFAPAKLDKPSNMITLKYLQSKFSSGWAPTYIDYNAFELECKDNWGRQKWNELHLVDFEQVSQLFDAEILESDPPAE